MGYIIKVTTEATGEHPMLRSEDNTTAWQLDNIKLYVSKKKAPTGKYYLTPYLDNALEYETMQQAQDHVGESSISHQYKILPF